MQPALPLKIQFPILLVWTLLQTFLAEAQHANSFYHKGRQLTQKKDYTNAIAAFDQALALDPNHVKALYQRGITRLYYLDDAPHALSDLELVIQKEPAFKKIIFYDLANAQSNLGLTEVAIENFNKSLELLPRFICAANNRGICQSDLGNFKEALQDFDEAIKKDSKEHKKNIYINRADAYANLDLWEKARKDFETALTIDPFNPYVFSNRANWEMERMEFGAAMNDLSIALKLQETPRIDFRSNLYNTRGFLYFLSGNYQKAIEDDDSMRTNQNQDYQLQFNYRNFAEKAIHAEEPVAFGCIIWDKFIGNTNNWYHATISRKNKINHTLGAVYYGNNPTENTTPLILVDGHPIACKWKQSQSFQKGFTKMEFQSNFSPLKGTHQYQLQLGLSVSQIVTISQETN